MKKEYDFSKGERGKFYKLGLKLNLPIYLEPETLSFVQNIARKPHFSFTVFIFMWFNKVLKFYKRSLSNSSRDNI